MQPWSTYFAATVGGAATLTGLIFVGVSINLKRILSNKHLPNRALEALVLLSNILVISSFCLVPGQSIFWLGCEILLVDIILWFIIFRMDLRMYKQSEKLYKSKYVQNIFLSQVAVLPFVAAGICMLIGTDAGFYLLIPGITFSFIKSLLDSWVLLVEINR